MATNDRVRGHLDGLVLAVLARAPGHGYAVIEILRDESQGELDLPEGSVYPALHRLEHAGLVSSAWAAGSTRRRRVYALTADGRRELTAQRKEWAAFAGAVSRVLGPSPAGAS